DEPTSALDPHHSEILFHLMLSLAKQQKIAVLLVTHDWDLVQRNELRTFSAKLDMSLRQSCFIEQANND
ncbi:MAG: ABC transporter ATP-binding protein, partial [Haemophilus parainfluenzae]|nr:ABC transporter ATP-binding protein [Haemophilus parainfluenzae]